MESTVFIERATKLSPQPIYVLYGDEDFLKRHAQSAIRRIVFGPEDDAFGLSVYAGDEAKFAEIRGELETLPFIGSHRLVLVESADKFVTEARTSLEKYFGQPSRTGTLVLSVKSWPANTKLSKMLADEATIVCKSMKSYQLPAWCAKWMAAQYGKRLPADVAGLLVEVVGSEMGVLDQEMAKLAIYVGSAKQIEAKDVDAIVASGRLDNMWKIFDAIGAGRSGAALAILDRLLDQGEEPLRLVGAFGSQLRRLAQIASLQRAGQPLARAMVQTGVQHWAQEGHEKLLRQLGERANRLFDWLLELDMGLKGGKQLPPRTLLERLVIQLARPA
jgi:DNA polymerase-3 subunit delta